MKPALGTYVIMLIGYQHYYRLHHEHTVGTSLKSEALVSTLTRAVDRDECNEQREQPKADIVLR